MMENNGNSESQAKENKEDLTVPVLILTFLAAAWIVYVYVNRAWTSAFQQAMSWILYPNINYTPVQIEGIPLAFLATIEVLLIGALSSHLLLFNEKDSGIKFVSALGLGFGLTGLITIILGIFGNLFQLPLNVIISLLCAGFLLIIVFKQRGKEKRSIRGLFRIPFSLKLSKPANFKLWLLSCTAISVIFFFCFYHALLTPIVHWDATVYHAVMSVIMYNDHSFPLIAGPSIGLQMSANFPPLFSALGAYYYVQIGTIEDFFLRAVAPVMGVLTVLATYKIGEILAGKKYGLVSALFLAITPLFFRYSIYATSYSTLTFFSTVSILFLLLAIIKGDTKYWISCGLFYGFALLTSYIAMYLAPFFIVVLIYYFVKRKNYSRTAIKRASALIVSTVIIAGVWYVRNLILLGNPIYPNAYTLLGGINIDPLIIETTFKGIKWSAEISFFGGEVPIFEKVMTFLTFRTHFPVISLFTILALVFLPTQNKKFWLIATWPLTLSVFVLSGISWGFPRHIVFALPGFALLSALPIMKVLELCGKYDANNGGHSNIEFARIMKGLPSIRKSNIIRIGLALLIFAAFLFPSLTLSMGGKEYSENLFDSVPEDYLWFLKNPNSDTWVVLNKLYPEAVAWNFLNEHLKEGEKVATVENRIYYVKNCSNDYFFYLDGWEARQLYNITDPAAMVRFLHNENVKYVVDVSWARLHGHFDILPMTQFLGSQSPYFPTILDHSYNPNIYNVGPFESPITNNSQTTISINQDGWSRPESIDGVLTQSVIAGNDSPRLYVATPNLTSLDITYLDVGTDIFSINARNPYSKEWIIGYATIQKTDTGKWKTFEFLPPLSEEGFIEFGFHAYTQNFTISRIDAAPYQSQGKVSLNSIDMEMTNTTLPPTLMVYLPFLHENETIQVQTNSFKKAIGLEIYKGIIQPWENTNWSQSHDLAAKTLGSIVQGQTNPSLVWKATKSGLYTLVIVLRDGYSEDTKVDLQISRGVTY